MMFPRHCKQRTWWLRFSNSEGPKLSLRLASIQYYIVIRYNEPFHGTGESSLSFEHPSVRKRSSRTDVHRPAAVLALRNTRSADPSHARVPWESSTNAGGGLGHLPKNLQLQATKATEFALQGSGGGRYELPSSPAPSPLSSTAFPCPIDTGVCPSPGSVSVSPPPSSRLRDLTGSASMRVRFTRPRSCSSSLARRASRSAV